MNCDNCGAEIDKDEEYCPNCGMQLFDLPPNPIKKKIDKISESSSAEKSGSDEKSDSLSKPIKQRYIEDSEPENPDYSNYNEYEDVYDEPPQYEDEVQETEDRPEVERKESSGSGMVNIILFLLIALILGFIVGLIMFSSQTILKIPGLNS